ncbi:MAG: hypothetical protein AAB455_02520 [Patescibacteria group bacterium]
MAFWRLLKSYLGWHYGLALVAWWRIYRDLLWFVYNFFSLPIIFRTLLAPWRRLGESYPKGFSPEVVAETIVINTLMRLVGVVFRLGFLIFALPVIVIVFLLGLVALIFWLAAPIALPIIFLIGFYLTFLA